MPFLGREKGRSKLRRSDDEFVVFLQGIPSHCRWQELKDLVRQTALHIRQAVVYDDNHGFPTGLGQIIVKNEDEAWRTYHRLSTNGWEGQSLVVTLSRTSTPTKPIAGPTRSPPILPSYVSGHSTPPQTGNMTIPQSPVSPESIPQTPPFHYQEYGMVMPQMQMQYILMPMPDPTPYYPPSPLNVHEQWTYQNPSFKKFPEPHSPTFHPDRYLTLDNLSASSTYADITKLVRTCGELEYCTLLSDGGRCQASVTMYSGDEARKAVAMLDNSFFMGTKIRVRIERGRVGSFDSGSGCSGSDGVGSSTWADEMSALEVEREVGKPLVIDGSGLNRDGAP